jgi:glutathione synthase
MAVASVDADDERIVAAISFELARHGLAVAGLDVIAGRLIEVNLTCPGGMAKTDALLGTDLSGTIMRRLLHHEESLQKGKVLA